jgi:RNA polymerase sigma factor (sigma-70 family)
VSGPEEPGSGDGAAATALAAAGAAERESRRTGLLVRVHGEGRERFPTVDLPFEVFALRVLQVVARPSGPNLELWPEELAERLEKSGGADLYLAIACDLGIEGAWEAFQQVYLPALRRIARNRGVRGSDVEEVAATLLADLATPAEGGAARTPLGSYSGAGTLLGWLTAVLRNRMVDERREEDRRTRTGEAWGERAAARSPGKTDNPSEEFDPASSVVDAETCRRFGDAFRAGLRRLTARERLAFTLRYRDGIAASAAARRMGVGEPRVSRLLQAALGKIRAAVAEGFPGERWEDLGRMWLALRARVDQEMGPAPRKGSRAVPPAADPS